MLLVETMFNIVVSPTNPLLFLNPNHAPLNPFRIQTRPRGAGKTPREGAKPSYSIRQHFPGAPGRHVSVPGWAFDGPLGRFADPATTDCVPGAAYADPGIRGRVPGADFRMPGGVFSVPGTDFSGAEIPGPRFCPGVEGGAAGLLSP